MSTSNDNVQCHVAMQHVTFTCQYQVSMSRIMSRVNVKGQCYSHDMLTRNARDYCVFSVLFFLFSILILYACAKNMVLVSCMFYQKK